MKLPMKYGTGGNGYSGFERGAYRSTEPKPAFTVTAAEVKDVQSSAGKIKNWAHWYAVFMAFGHHPSRSVAWWEDAFKRAQAAHHAYEATLGRVDAEWAAWYAEFLTKASSNR